MSSKGAPGQKCPYKNKQTKNSTNAREHQDATNIQKTILAKYVPVSLHGRQRIHYTFENV